MFTTTSSCLVRAKMVELPKIGDAIPVEKLFVSKMNARFEDSFGKTMEDTVLTEHLGKQGIVQPFIVRPEGKGFGVVIGRRRFLAKKKSGAKKFIVGTDCLVKEMSDEEALDASMQENLDIFRQELNPLARAKMLKKIVETKDASMRELARLWRVPISNLSEWMKPLELSQPMQALIEKGELAYTDALKLARLNLNAEEQSKLATTFKKEGSDAFQSELERIQQKQEKRGAPKGKYVVFRLTFNSTVPEETEAQRRLEVLANSAHKPFDEYCKMILIEHALGKR